MEPKLIPLSSEEKSSLQTDLLNSVGQAVLVVDLDGRIVYWNDSAETLYGYSDKYVAGRKLINVLGIPTLMKSVLENMKQLESGEGWSKTYPVKKRDGSVLSTNLSAALIKNERLLISIIGISRESTEHQQLLEANRLLAQASALLVDTQDNQTSLTTLAKLAVPQLSDWCAVHLLQPDGTVSQVALAPDEIVKLQAAYEWLQNQLPKDEINGLPAVLRSGEPKLITDVDSNPLTKAASIKSYMIVPLIAHPQTLGAMTFVAAESQRKFDQNALSLAENLASHIAIYLEKTHLYRESQRLNSELEKHVKDRTVELRELIAQLEKSETMIQTLFRISNKLNSTLDVDNILDELAQEAIKIVNGESGFAGLRTAEGMTVRKYFTHGMAIPFVHTWAPGTGVPGWVLVNKIPYGTSDAENDPVMNHSLIINKGIRSLICTPIFDSMGEVLGYFDIRNKQDSEGFTINDQEMLMALAPAASIAIQNALAYQQRAMTVTELKDSSKKLQALAASIESAREEERTQISRELHDQLGQALTAMKIDLALLTDKLVSNDVTLAKKTKSVTSQIDAMIKTVRRIATELRPGMLDDLGLAASIEWQAHDFEKRTGIVCAVSIPSEDLPVSRSQSLAMFRIFQEALTNISRHAKAQHVEITLTSDSESINLQIHDDGRGILLKEIAGENSLGLLGMRERALRVGGIFDIQGLPGDGTILTVTIPLKQPKKID
jgi:PAS domain S-box-containing protein